MKILFLGDLFGRSGRKALEGLLPGLINRYTPNLVICNVENASHGSGVSRKVMDFLAEQEIDVYTSGNHVMEKSEAEEILNTEDKLLRPANFPIHFPGRGYGIFRASNNISVAVINIQGTVFMPKIRCPFREMDSILEQIKGKVKHVFVDFHAEATSEKRSMAWYLDGRVTALIGTHTHVQTADEEILPNGTAFLSDAGMTGPHNSVIGVRKEIIQDRFLKRMPQKFEPAAKGNIVCGVYVEADDKTGKAQKIIRIREKYD